MFVVMDDRRQYLEALADQLRQLSPQDRRRLRDLLADDPHEPGRGDS